MNIRTLAKIKRICKDRFVTLIEYPYFCRIIAPDYDLYLDVSIPIHKMSGVRVLRNYYTLSIDVYDKSDFERCEEVATQKRFFDSVILYCNAHHVRSVLCKANSNTLCIGTSRVPGSIQ